MPDLPDPGVSQLVRDGRTADAYFWRSRQVLTAEGRNPVETMEVFPSRAGVLCGMREVLALLLPQLPADAEVLATAEGERIEAKQVVLRITAPYLSYGLYETAILGYLAHESGWATAAAECVEAAAGARVVSFGARHVHPDIAARMDYAAVVGGCVACSTLEGARLAGVPAAGTMPHALVLTIGDTVEAALAFDRHIEPEVPRIVLVDTFQDEAVEALRVAQAMGERLSGIRLDTPWERGGVTISLVHEVRARLDQAGFQHVRIFVSGGLTPARIREYLADGAPIDSFGVGSYISGARPIDFTADIKAIEGRPVAKRGRIPGLTASPGLKPVR
jgi:nicotinate phosphoribosyltransferase